MQVTDEQKQYVRNLLIEDRKIEAVKFIRSNYGLNLQDATRLVELIDEDIREDEYQYDRAKVVNKTIKKGSGCVGIVFMVIGAFLLIFSTLAFIGNQVIVAESVEVRGEVIATPGNPLFQYEFDGETYEYQSDVSSDPPAYELGEEVSIYVNPQNPNEVLIDTFMDRWFAIVLLGGMGAVFFGIGLVIKLASRKVNIRRQLH